MTMLGELQKAIDDCNGGKSCYKKEDCEYAGHTDECPRIIAHTARMDYCEEHDIPIERW